MFPCLYIVRRSPTENSRRRMTVIQSACDRTSTKSLHDGEFHLPKCVPLVARPSCICTAQNPTLGSDQRAWSFVAWLWHAFIRRNPIFHSISPKPGCGEKKNKWKIELQTLEEEEPTMGREFDEWQTEGRKLNAEREKFEEGENFFKVPIRRRFVTWLSRSWRGGQYSLHFKSSWMLSQLELVPETCSMLCY